MAARKHAPTDDMVEELVHQFSDPFAFFRELIQNSIDAGSSRIEVTLRFKPGPRKGVATAEVRDWGEGMSREIIEKFLVVLFRSSKEEDLTKIGKFGIGFVSIFAAEPDLVVVDTGRDGEDWRMLLHPDRTYELLRGPEPIDGTRVTFHKEMPASDFAEFAGKSEEAVRRWCRHSEADVAFAAGGADGSPSGAPVPIREPFVVEAPFQVEHREEGTHIVAGPSREEPPFCGFYNRGLTLLETREAMVPGVTFKIVSRYLEHTLTRDNVRREKHFDKAMSLVKKLAAGPLLARLRDELKASAERRDQDYLRLMALGQDRLGHGDLWFPLAQGGAVDGKTLAKAASRKERLYYAERDRPVARALTAAGVPVILGRDPSVLAMAAALTEHPQALAASEYVVASPGEQSGAERGLAESLAALLRSVGGRFERAVVADLDGYGDQAAFVCAAETDEPQHAEKAARSPFAWRAPAVLCLNRRHSEVADAVRLAERSPKLAAYLLARTVAVSIGALDHKLDRKLTEAGLRD